MRLLTIDFDGVVHPAKAGLPPGSQATSIRLSKLFFDERLNWKLFTEEEPELAGRRVYWPRGKILGGTSAINGMVYTRTGRCLLTVSAVARPAR